MGYVRCYPATLTEVEWRLLEALFVKEGDAFYALAQLKEHKNLPQLALDLFPVNKSRGSCMEQMNNTMRTSLVPFRLHRIGSWARPFRGRRLSIVRWGVGTQKSLDFNPRYELAS